MYVGIAEFPLNILASNGNKASGLKPHPKNIYWYVTNIWLVFKALSCIPYPIITPESYLTALTIIFVSFTTIDGLIIPVVNLNEVCLLNAYGFNTTLIIFKTLSIVHVYNDEFNSFIMGAFVFLTLVHVPFHLNVFF